MTSEKTEYAPPPHDLAAEDALLACLLLDPPCMKDVASRLKPDDFYSTANRHVYSAALSLHFEEKPCDALLVLDHLRGKDLLEEVGGKERLSNLAAVAATSANAIHYADLIVTCAYKRHVAQVASGLDRAAKNGVAPHDATTAAVHELRFLQGMYAPASESLFGVVSVNATDQTPYLIRGMFAKGLITLVHGLPKVGKTTFAYAALASLLRGDNTFIGLAVPESVDALVLTEEPESIIAETYRTAGIDATRCLTLPRERAFPRRPLPAIVDSAIQAVEKNPKIAVVLVDTWRFWANLGDKQENDAGSVNRAYDEFRRIAARGVAVCLIHHSRKSGGEDGTSAAGSNALTGSADLILEVLRFGKAESSSLRQITFLGRLQRLPQPLIVDYRDGRFLEMGDASRAKDKLRDDRVRGCLANCARWLTSDEVAEAVGIKATHVLAALKSLVDRHEIQQIGRGRRNAPYLYASLDVPLQSQPNPPAIPPE